MLAGVDVATRSSHVVQLALAEAARRHARVRLVHGAKGPLGGVEDIDPTAYAAWLRRAQRELEADFSALTGSHPDVAVELEVVPEAPATALVAKARGAAVVVMGTGPSGPSVRQAPRAGHGRGAASRRMPGAGRRREPSDPRSAPTRALAGRHRMRPREGASRAQGVWPDRPPEATRVVRPSIGSPSALRRRAAQEQDQSRTTSGKEPAMMYDMAPMGPIWWISGLLVVVLLGCLPGFPGASPAPASASPSHRPRTPPSSCCVTVLRPARSTTRST